MAPRTQNLEARSWRDKTFGTLGPRALPLLRSAFSIITVMSLHPEIRALLDNLDRPQAIPFHLLTVAQQRDANTMMHCGLRPDAPDVAFAEEDVMARPAEEGGALRFRHYRPWTDDPSTPLPVLVWFHGGGWTIGNIESYDVLCRELANRSGCAVISVGYRLAPEFPFPAAVDDAFFATRWVAENADRLHVDKTRLAVGGDSAGGNLAAAVCLLARDDGGPAIAFQLLVYPATDQRGLSESHRQFATGYLLTQQTIRHFQRCYLQKEGDSLDWRASPLLAPTHVGLPPAYILTASHDPLVDDCRLYAEKLRAASVPVEEKCFPGMVHGFLTLGKIITDANQAVTDLGDALQRALD